MPLIEQIGAGTVRRGWIDACASVPAPRIVRLATRAFGAVLGADVSADDIRRILAGLGFMLAGEAPITRWCPCPRGAWTSRATST